jgi:hypothetical protein
MSALCVTAAGLALSLPLQTFTLAWTHSIEKIRWEEDYRIAGRRLELMEARIRGSGAGMEPPAGALLKEGVWHYKPALAPLERLRLTRSPYAADYVLCWDGACHPLAQFAGPVDAAPLVELSACDGAPVTATESTTRQR